MNMLNGFLDHELQNLPNDARNNPPGPLHRQTKGQLAPRRLEHAAPYDMVHLAHASDAPQPSSAGNYPSPHAASAQTSHASSPKPRKARKTKRTHAKNADSVPAVNDTQSSDINCVPCRQKNAESFLRGDTPGVMAFYAPEQTSKAAEAALAADNVGKEHAAQNAALESDETVARLVQWREDAAF